MPLAPRFTEVVVTNEQTGAVWKARTAEVLAGRIHVKPARTAPEGMFAMATYTFTIIARDGAGRLRTFVSVVVDRSVEGEGAVVFV